MFGSYTAELVDWISGCEILLIHGPVKQHMYIAQYKWNSTNPITTVMSEIK